MGPLEFIYYLGYSIEKSRELKKRRRLPRKVISLGNLTLGGTGKTPAVMAVAGEALKRGFQPCVLTRGYGGRAKDPCFVSEGSDILLSVEDAGDEAFLMAKRLKGVPIVKCGNRYEGGMFALRRIQAETSDPKSRILFILDDGFQHWRLERDKDVLLIDGTNPFGNRKLFPSGVLREPLHEMKRADMILLTKVSPEPSGHVDINSLMNEIRKYNPDAPIYVSEHRSVCLCSPSDRELPMETLSGKKAFLFSGIANPSSFKQSLLMAGAEVEGHMIFRDHHKYDSGDLRRILDAAKRCGADWIVTTEKDIIKLSKFGIIENLLALRIELKIEESFYYALFREE
jgi:tetraacyldisaccharide 4'-kinase